jgi:hypothetical protein
LSSAWQPIAKPGLHGFEPRNSQALLTKSVLPKQPKDARQQHVDNELQIDIEHQMI